MLVHCYLPRAVALGNLYWSIGVINGCGLFLLLRASNRSACVFVFFMCVLDVYNTTSISKCKPSYKDNWYNLFTPCCCTCYVYFFYHLGTNLFSLSK
jgi:hypothetical protein